MFVIHSAQSASEPAKPEPGATQSTSTGETGAKDSFFARDPNFASGSGFGAGTKELYFRAIVAILFVIALGIVAVYVSKRLLPRIIKVPSRRIRVIETVHLGPRKAVHVLEVGNRRLLVGSTAENITTLADITDEIIDSPAHDGGNR